VSVKDVTCVFWAVGAVMVLVTHTHTHTHTARQHCLQVCDECVVSVKDVTCVFWAVGAVMVLVTHTHTPRTPALPVFVCI